MSETSIKQKFWTHYHDLTIPQSERDEFRKGVPTKCQTCGDESNLFDIGRQGKKNDEPFCDRCGGQDFIITVNGQEIRVKKRE